MGVVEELASRWRFGGRVEVPRDVVRATGPDAVSFLQGQLSQDIAALADGGSAFSLLLEPQGKVNTFLRVTRVGPEELLLDTDAGYGGAMVARLERFRLRVKCDFERLDWRCVAVRTVDERWSSSAGEAVSVVPETPGVTGCDLLGPSPETALPEADPVAYEALRIATGVPRMGAELDESTIPAAAGIVERSASFTKGCYTGQELVARIDSRGGNTPTRLRGVVVETGPVPPVGARLLVGGDDVGPLTSVAAVADGAVALAYVKRAVEPPVEAQVAWPGGEVPARLEPLPLSLPSVGG